MNSQINEVVITVIGKIKCNMDFFVIYHIIYLIK